MATSDLPEQNKAALKWTVTLFLKKAKYHNYRNFSPYHNIASKLVDEHANGLSNRELLKLDGNVE
jgi:hypothetical protein